VPQFQMKTIVCDAKILSVAEVRNDFNECVAQHSCRISIDLYQRLMSELDLLADAEGP